MLRRDSEIIVIVFFFSTPPQFSVMIVAFLTVPFPPTPDATPVPKYTIYEHASAPSYPTTSAF